MLLGAFWLLAVAAAQVKPDYDDSYGYKDSYEENIPPPTDDQQKEYQAAYDLISGKYPFFPIPDRSCHVYDGGVKPCLCPMYLYIIMEWLEEDDQAQLRMMDTATSMLTRYYKNVINRVALIEVDPEGKRREFGVKSRRFSRFSADVTGPHPLFKHTYAANLSSALHLIRQEYLGPRILEQPDVAILLSDGVFLDKDAALNEAKAVRDEGAQLFAVEIGRNGKTDYPTLEKFTQDKERTFSRGDGTADAVGKQIKTMVCATCCTHTKTPDDCQKKTTMGILVETSTVMGELPFRAVQDFLRQLIKGFPHLDFQKIAVGTYSKKFQPVIDMDNRKSPDEEDRLIRTIQWKGGPSNTDVAMASFAKHLGWTTYKKEFRHMVLITAGDSSDKHKTREVARELWMKNVRISAIGVSTKKIDELDKITGGNYPNETGGFRTFDHTVLRGKVDEMVKFLCWNAGPEVQEKCYNPIDFVFGIDVTLPEATFELAKSIVRNVIQHSILQDIGRDVQRVVVFTYGTARNPIVTLMNSYSLPRMDHLIRISAVPYVEDSDTGVAIISARGLLNPKRRDLHAKVLVLLTHALKEDPAMLKVDADIARREGIEIRVVEMGKDANKDAIKMLVNDDENSILRSIECNPDENLDNRECENQLVRKICPGTCESECPAKAPCPK